MGEPNQIQFGEIVLSFIKYSLPRSESCHPRSRAGRLVVAPDRPLSLKMVLHPFDATWDRRRWLRGFGKPFLTDAGYTLGGYEFAVNIKTTQVYDRREDEVSFSEIERVGI